MLRQRPQTERQARDEQDRAACDRGCRHPRQPSAPGRAQPVRPRSQPVRRGSARSPRCRHGRRPAAGRRASRRVARTQANCGHAMRTRWSRPRLYFVAAGAREWPMNSRLQRIAQRAVGDEDHASRQGREEQDTEQAIGRFAAEPRAGEEDQAAGEDRRHLQRRRRSCAPDRSTRRRSPSTMRRRPRPTGQAGDRSRADGAAGRRRRPAARRRGRRSVRHRTDPAPDRRWAVPRTRRSPATDRQRSRSVGSRVQPRLPALSSSSA